MESMGTFECTELYDAAPRIGLGSAPAWQWSWRFCRRNFDCECPGTMMCPAERKSLFSATWDSLYEKEAHEIVLEIMRNTSLRKKACPDGRNRVSMLTHVKGSSKNASPPSTGFTWKKQRHAFHFWLKSGVHFKSDVRCELFHRGCMLQAWFWPVHAYHFNLVICETPCFLIKLQINELNLRTRQGLMWIVPVKHSRQDPTLHHVASVWKTTNRVWKNQKESAHLRIEQVCVVTSQRNADILCARKNIVHAMDC
jgi:hypothetical protein